MYITTKEYYVCDVIDLPTLLYDTYSISSTCPLILVVGPHLISPRPTVIEDAAALAPQIMSIVAATAVRARLLFLVFQAIAMQRKV